MYTYVHIQLSFHVSVFSVAFPSKITYTYGLVGDKMNMDEYGSIGFGPSSTSSSSSFLASSFFLFWNILTMLLWYNNYIS